MVTEVHDGQFMQRVHEVVDIESAAGPDETHDARVRRHLDMDEAALLEQSSSDVARRTT